MGGCIALGWNEGLEGYNKIGKIIEDFFLDFFLGFFFFPLIETKNEMTMQCSHLKISAAKSDYVAVSYYHLTLTWKNIDLGPRVLGKYMDTNMYSVCTLVISLASKNALIYQLNSTSIKGQSNETKHTGTPLEEESKHNIASSVCVLETNRGNCENQ